MVTIAHFLKQLVRVVLPSLVRSSWLEIISKWGGSFPLIWLCSSAGYRWQWEPQFFDPGERGWRICGADGWSVGVMFCGAVWVAVQSIWDIKERKGKCLMSELLCKVFETSQREKVSVFDLLCKVSETSQIEKVSIYIWVAVQRVWDITYRKGKYLYLSCCATCLRHHREKKCLCLSCCAKCLRHHRDKN